MKYLATSEESLKGQQKPNKKNKRRKNKGGMNDNDPRLNEDDISFSLDSSRKNKKSDRTIFYR